MTFINILHLKLRLRLMLYWQQRSIQCFLLVLIYIIGLLLRKYSRKWQWWCTWHVEISIFVVGSYCMMAGTFDRFIGITCHMQFLLRLCLCSSDPCSTSFLYTAQAFCTCCHGRPWEWRSSQGETLGSQKKGIKSQTKHDASIMLTRLTCTAQKVSEQEARCFTHSRCTPSNWSRRQWQVLFWITWKFIEANTI